MTISLEEHVARAIAVAYADFGNSASQMARAAIDTMRGPAWYEYLDSIRESERAACEAIALAERDFWGETSLTGYGAERVATKIGARKGKG
jgi:hypothetical protein